MLRHSFKDARRHCRLNPWQRYNDYVGATIKVASFSKKITASVQKAGKTLVFSILDEKLDFITRARNP